MSCADEQKDLAKDFGFDVTVPDGGIWSSAACNRLYKNQCRRIYSEFILNMRDYMFNEDQIKGELHRIHRESQKSPSRFNVSPRSPRIPCRSERENIDVPKRKISRPQCGRISIAKSRPKSEVSARRKEVESQDVVDGEIKTIGNKSTETKTYNKLKNASQSTLSKDDVKASPVLEQHDAILESKANSSCRVIKMSPRAFSKLVCGKADVRILNKEHGYLLRPLSDSHAMHLKNKNTVTSNCTERLALVREKTNFQSTTLSHDLKVNNIVSIKKCLLGECLEPIPTVGDRMASARERRSRLFRVQLTNDDIKIDDAQLDMRSGRNVNFSPRLKKQGHKESSLRLTQRTLARLEMDVQRDAVERLRQNVIQMTKGYQEISLNHKSISTNKNKEGSHLQNDVTNENILSSPKTYTSRQPSDHPEYRQNKLNIKDERDNPCIFSNDRVNGTKLRSEMSLRPSTFQSGLCSQRSYSKKLNHHDTVAYIRRSQQDDSLRENEINRWRQRMTFVVGKY